MASSTWIPRPAFPTRPTTGGWGGAGPRTWDQKAEPKGAQRGSHRAQPAPRRSSVNVAPGVSDPTSWQPPPLLASACTAQGCTTAARENMAEGAPLPQRGPGGLPNLQALLRRTNDRPLNALMSRASHCSAGDSQALASSCFHSASPPAPTACGLLPRIPVTEPDCWWHLGPQTNTE